MTMMSDLNARMDQDEDEGSWTDHDGAIQRHDLFNSEGEDLGAAMGFLAVGAAIVCALGVAAVCFVSTASGT